jgi:microcystin-dependent protein
MSIFTFNNHNNIPPPGTIVQYYGNVDPDGWLICDGVNRTSTDGRYSRLAILLNTMQGITTNTSNSITPPDLRSNFLFGSSNTTSDIGTFGGSATQTISISNMPSHRHEGGDTGNQSADHTHTYKQPGNGANAQPAGGDDGRWGVSGGALAATTGNTSANHTHTYTLNNPSEILGNPIEIIPSHLKINHIIKY